MTRSVIAHWGGVLPRRGNSRAYKKNVPMGRKIKNCENLSKILSNRVKSLARRQAKRLGEKWRRHRKKHPENRKKRERKAKVRRRRNGHWGFASFAASCCAAWCWGCWDVRWLVWRFGIIRGRCPEFFRMKIISPSR